MLTTVHLHGHLGREFGRTHQFALHQPVDAVRALDAAFPGRFLRALREGEYRVVRGTPGRHGRDLDIGMLTMGLSGQPLHIIPVPAGAKRGGAAKIVLGVVLVAAAIAFAPAGAGMLGANLGAEAFSVFGSSISFGNIALFGAGMALQGAAQMLSPQPKAAGSLETADRRQSSLFNGAVTSVEQGGVVPLVYGRVRTGGTVISAGLSVEDVPTSSAAADDVGTGDDGGTEEESGDGATDGDFPDDGPSGAGGGGGKGGGGSGRVAQEDPNTLTAKSTARILYLVGEGELELVDGAKSIYLDDTPLMAADGTWNVEGVSWAWRTGLPDQPHIEGFSAAETEVTVSAEVKKSAAVTRTITDTNADAARITVQVPALTTQDGDDGDLHGGTVGIAIDVRPAGGIWQERVAATIDGKTTSAYERAWRVELPSGGAPWDVRVRRTTDDHTDDVKIQDKTFWKSFSVIVDGKFTYPDSALLALTFAADQYGGRLPTIGVDVRRVGLEIPSNYDPVARTYTGIWDGTFKPGATENPAWVLWDALTNPRYGLGDVLGGARVDRWRLYQIARYCDQMIPSGFKDAAGIPILEPRYTFNGVLATREDAFATIQAICSNFRGMAYWGSGSVHVTADMPDDPAQLVTRANVVDGVISYAGTARKARHTVAKVYWNDPSDGYRQTVEVVELPDLIATHGWNETEITAFGCCRRSQARRMGLWLLLTEHAETHTGTYTAGLDHMQAAPGQLVNVADPAFAGVRMGGRLLAATDRTVTLDAPVTIEAGKGYALSVVLPDGSVAERTVLADPGAWDVLTLAEPLPTVPTVLAVWVLTASDLAPRPFRVRAVRELAPGRFEVTALLHDPTKYARIEQGLALDPPSYVRDDAVLPAPTNLSAVESVYWVNGLPSARVSVSWTPAANPTVTGYDAQVMTPGGQWQNWKVSRSNGLDIEPAAEGKHVIRVSSVAYDGRVSRPAEITITVSGKGTPPGQPTALATTGGVRQITLTWGNPADTDLSHIEVWASETDDFRDAAKLAEVKATTWVNAGLPGIVTRWYWVRAVDLGGNVGDFNSNLGTPGTSLPLGVDDIATSVYSRWKDDLVTDLPGIDFTFLDSFVARRIDDSALAETVLRLTAQSYDRFAEIKRERGLTDSKIAVVDTKITETADSITGALAEQITTVASEFDDKLAVVNTSLTTLATNTSAVATSVETLRVDLGDSITAAVASERTARVTATEAVANAVQALRTDFNGNTATVASELRALSTATSATATLTDTLVTRVGVAEGSIQREISSRTTAEGIFNNAFTVMRGDIANAFGLIQAETAQRVSAEGIFNNAFTVMRGQVGQAQADILKEISTRTTADSALAADISQLRTRLDGNNASVATELKAWVDNRSATAQYTQQLLTTVGAHQTGIQTLANSLNGLSAHYAVTIDNNGYVAGFDLISKPVGGSPSSAFIVRADNFQVGMPGYGEATPFTIAPVNGTPTVAITNAMIQDAAIGTLKIQNQAVGVSMGIFGTGFQNVSSGSSILDGTITIASSCTLVGTFIGTHSSAAGSSFSYQVRGPYGGSSDALLFDSGTMSGGNNVMAANLYYALGPGAHRFYVKMHHDGASGHSCKNLGLNLTAFYR